jgi:hypothetical protein
MTLQKAINIFDILQDKYGSPYVDPDETVDLLNMATFEWLNRLIPSNVGGVVNYEFDSNILTNIKPLVFAITANMNGSGVLTNASIATALQTGGAEAGASWFRIGNVGITVDGELYPIKFKRHNEIFVHERNFFKKGTVTRPSYTIRYDGLKFYPIDAVNLLSLTVVKNPRLMSLDGPLNPELDDLNMYNIISIALKLNGIATRDEEIIMDVRNAALQISQ